MSLEKGHISLEVVVVGLWYSCWWWAGGGSGGGGFGETCG